MTSNPNLLIILICIMGEYQYAIFRTHWGFFGLVGGEMGIVRTCLPVAHKEAIYSRMLSDLPNAQQSKKAFSALKKSIEAYYKGKVVDFSDVPVCLEGLSDFQQKVLLVLQKIKYGRSVTYGEMAEIAGSPRGARAIGSVMAINPVPLIIPCHRVIKADGSVGQFSAAGGTDTKIRMLKMEESNL